MLEEVPTVLRSAPGVSERFQNGFSGGSREVPVGFRGISGDTRISLGTSGGLRAVSVDLRGDLGGLRGISVDF